MATGRLAFSVKLRKRRRDGCRRVANCNRRDAAGASSPKTRAWVAREVAALTSFGIGGELLGVEDLPREVGGCEGVFYAE
jgi:hypothetical protein